MVIAVILSALPVYLRSLLPLNDTHNAFYLEDVTAGGPADGYPVNIGDVTDGDAGLAAVINGNKFSTYDEPNQLNEINCSAKTGARF